MEVTGATGAGVLSKRHIWWEYFKSERKARIVIILHIVISAVIILFLRLLYSCNIFPSFTIKPLIDLINSIDVSSLTGSIISTGFVGTFICGLLKVFKNGFDSTFMTSFERKIKRIITIVLSLIMYTVLFISTLIILTVAYSSIKTATYARLILLGFILLWAIFVVFYYMHKLNNTGRSDILTFWESFYIVSLLVSYPIKEVSLSFMIVYTIGVLIGTGTILHYLDDANINNSALYYFKEKDESDVYIHYRLDDYRVVCSKDMILKPDSQRILYEISNLCETKLFQCDRCDQHWKDTIAQIRRIKEIEKENIDKTIQEIIAEAIIPITKMKEKIQIKIRELKEKYDRIKRLEAKADKYKNLAKKWEDDCKALQKNNAKLVAELEKINSKHS